MPNGRTDRILINKKKRTCHLAYFAVPIDLHTQKNEERQKAEQIPEL